MKNLLLFASLLCWFNTLFGQEPHYINYTTEDGLLSSRIYQIKQDRNNNIWFATNFGISRYNGSSFRNYSYEDGLQALTVLSMYEDIDGKLFFLPMTNDIHIYNPIFDKMEFFPFVDENKMVVKIHDKGVSSFQVQKNGELELGFARGGGYGIIKKGGVVKFHNDTTNGGVHIRSGGKELFFYSADTLNYLTVNGQKISYNNTNSAHLKGTSLDNDFIALSQGNQLTLIHNDSIVETKFFKKTIIEVNSDKKNNVWVSFYRGGTKCYTIVESKLIEKKHFLKEYSVTSVIEDHEGGYWFSTLETGVYYTPNINIKFFDSESGLSGLNIKGIEGNGDDEVVLVYSDGSITVFRSDSIYRIFDDIKKEVDYHSTINHIDYDKLNDQYLISNFGAPIILKDGELNLDKFKFIECYQMLSDKIENGFWYKNNTSIGYVNNDSLIYEYPSEQKRKAGLLYDFDGSVMVNFESESKRYTREKEIYKEVKNDQKYLVVNRYGISDSIHILNTLDGTHIVKPNSRAIFFYKKGEMFTQVIVDSINTFWVTSYQGLSRLTLEGDSIFSEKFSHEIGVLDNEQRAIYKLKESLWIHSTKGLYIIDEKDIVSIEPSAPTVNIISSSDSTYRNPEQNYIFKSNENNLTFKLQAITFKYNGEYKFEYQLDGITEGYKELGSNELNLTNLNYGKYTLDYRIKTINGIYSPESHFSFEILTPFSATWWFITFIVIGLLIIAFLIVRKIVNRILTREKKKSEMKELIHSLRLQSIQSQFNPHFTFNAINSIQRHISPTTANDAKIYLGMFSSIMRSILINSEKETIPLEEELKLLKTYLTLEQLRFKDKLNYEFRIAPSVNPEYDRIPPMIIQPVLENAINYGIFNKPEEGGTILIDFNVEDDVLYCTIEDDGIGFEAVKKIQEVKRIKRTGKGLSLVKERLGVNNKVVKNYFEKVDLFDDNGLAVGTRVILKIELND